LRSEASETSPSTKRLAICDISVPRLKKADNPLPASPETSSGGVQAETDIGSGAKVSPAAALFMAVTRYDTLSVDTAP
jgi:hypothetical protein